MLRLVVLFLSLYSCFSIAEYVEPTNELLDKQKARMNEVVTDAEHLMQTQEFKKQLESDLRKIQSIQGSSNNFLNIPDLSINNLNRDDRFGAVDDNNIQPELISNPLIFISFSMPDSEIEILMNEAKSIGAGVFIQGFIDDEFKKTYEKISQLTNVTGVGVGIDPTLFERFDINVVPSFVLPFEPITQCNKSTCDVPNYVKSSGASLRYFLDYLVRNGDKKEQEIANKWLNQEE